LDKARVREAIPLPELWPALRWRISGQRLFCHAPCEELLFSQQIAAGEKETRDHPNDADGWRRLAQLYARAKNSKGERAALDRAAVLYRRRIEAEPNCGLTMARYADCLEMPAGREEAELLLRAAVELSPGEWECWVLLGHFVLEDARSAVVESEQFARDHEATPTEYEKPDSICMTEARRARDLYLEAEECYNRAVAVAPDAADVYLHRAVFRGSREDDEAYLRVIFGAPAGSPPLRTGLDSAFPDLEMAAALSPTDPSLVGTIPIATLWVRPEPRSYSRAINKLRYAETLFDPPADPTKPGTEAVKPASNSESDPQRKADSKSVVDHPLLGALSQAGPSKRTKQYKDFRSLSAEDQRKVDSYLTRLETLAADERLESAAAAWAAGTTFFVLKDWTRAERNLRRAFTLDARIPRRSSTPRTRSATVFCSPRRITSRVETTRRSTSRRRRSNQILTTSRAISWWPPCCCAAATNSPWHAAVSCLINRFD
jgi:tetratricopeptide (TPR) repeat protein